MTKDEATGRGGYHHGDLRQAMVEAAEAVLAEKGIGGFTLRECARRAGVSPAAPAHHFGNLAGLLTAIATLGFDDLSEAMEAAAVVATESRSDRLAAIAEAYLATALARPGRFRVVFGQLGLRHGDEDLQRAGRRAFGILVRETKLALARPGGEGPLHLKPADFADDPDLGTILFVWSLTHGFSTLLLDRQLGFFEEARGREPLLRLYSEKLVGLLVAAVRPAGARTGARPLANSPPHG